MFSSKQCVSQHKPRQCPAFGKQCCNCQGKNHFAKKCFSKGKEKKTGRSINIVEDTDLSETFFVGMVNCKKEKQVNATREDCNRCVQDPNAAQHRGYLEIKFTQSISMIQGSSYKQVRWGHR